MSYKWSLTLCRQSLWRRTRRFFPSRRPSLSFSASRRMIHIYEAIIQSRFFCCHSLREYLRTNWPVREVAYSSAELVSPESKLIRGFAVRWSTIQWYIRVQWYQKNRNHNSNANQPYSCPLSLSVRNHTVGGWFGVAVTAFVTSTNLSYVPSGTGIGDDSSPIPVPDGTDEWWPIPSRYLGLSRPLRPTQPGYPSVG